MKVKRLTAKQILREAARILKTHGWVQYIYSDGTGYCLLGAVRKAAFGDVNFPAQHTNTRSYMAAMARLDQLTNNRVTDWNDKKSRKLKEVLALLSSAARSCR